MESYSDLLLEKSVKHFYSKLQFPGPYTIQDLVFYSEEIVNPYLRLFDEQVSQYQTVLDVGCGSGFIVNLLARRNPSVKFTAVDFSDSIDYAKQFSEEHGITNVTYIKDNFLTMNFSELFDVVFSNGVLHHIPAFSAAVQRVKWLARHKMVIGIYNKYGKMAKKMFAVKYVNEVLRSDQEDCPFEMSFSDAEFRRLFEDAQLETVFPSLSGHLVDLRNVFNYTNGGLTVYVFKPQQKSA